jgi:transposase
LQENAARVFDAKTGAEDEAVHEQEVEKLHAAIGKLTVERDFLSKRACPWLEQGLGR